jgi:hypothetical protein
MNPLEKPVATNYARKCGLDIFAQSSSDIYKESGLIAGALRKDQTNMKSIQTIDTESIIKLDRPLGVVFRSLDDLSSCNW